MKWKVRLPRFPRASRRVLLWAGLAIVVMVLWMSAPFALRRLAFFRVRQVELVGIRYLDAERVLAALQLAPRASVFDETRVLSERVRALDGIADASVLRRPPASLKVIVREVEPIALVANARGALAVVDADGRTLPFDPASAGAAATGGGLDLPLVRAAERASGDSSVLEVLARVRAFDPALFQAIDVARAEAARDAVILELGSHRVLLRRDAGPEVIEAVVLVARDLAAKARSYVELDARFAGQVVVRRRPRNGSA